MPICLSLKCMKAMQHKGRAAKLHRKVAMSLATFARFLNHPRASCSPCPAGLSVVTLTVPENMQEILSVKKGPESFLHFYMLFMMDQNQCRYLCLPHWCLWDQSNSPSVTVLVLPTSLYNISTFFCIYFLSLQVLWNLYMLYFSSCRRLVIPCWSTDDPCIHVFFSIVLRDNLNHIMIWIFWRMPRILFLTEYFPMLCH